MWCSTKTTFNVHVSQRSQIRFEDEYHAVYMPDYQTVRKFVSGPYLCYLYRVSQITCQTPSHIERMCYALCSTSAQMSRSPWGRRFKRCLNFNFIAFSKDLQHVTTPSFAIFIGHVLMLTMFLSDSLQT